MGPPLAARHHSRAAGRPPIPRGWMPLLSEIPRGEERVMVESRVSVLWSALPNSLRNMVSPKGALNRFASWSSATSAPGLDKAEPGATAMGNHLKHNHKININIDTNMNSTTTITTTTTTTASSSNNNKLPVNPSAIFSNTNTTKTVVSALRMPNPMPIASSPSGVGWKMGKQGLNLIMSSGQEAVYGTVCAGQVTASAPGDYDAQLERATYIDGVKYLLDGLPRDLDGAEVAGLRLAMPAELADSVALLDEDPQTRHRRVRQKHHHHQGGRRWRSTSTEDRGLAHSCMMFVLGWLVSCLSWCRPLFFLWAAAVLRVEREFKLAEKIMRFAVVLAREVCEAVVTVSNSPTGHAMSDALGFASDGVSGFLYEFARDEMTSRRKKRD
ncbi:hypothetical protein B0T26DRAFT_749654 [Lasiosphaeria miniovina]|uniref:Uncharacterized protein n=1 Tax=Lasiosphaeria miniovina TaxID=1954250 RepID=A0AA40AUF9_9PEZI|nr:uncharacterized protein B0T26DRAFT_749654 [Lasiosphaeria miniovina]KAK0722233.1 hypothetical protein B0T26DRAFT_749654 [Lasiosphaeria miniovina]